MSEPHIKTIKRLFAVSGNRCDFPKCQSTLVDADTGKVTGKICHIKGSRPGSARYDPQQGDEERHGYDNLLLMCPIHHDVVDSDAESYTVERLREIKSRHEALYAGGSEPSDEIANQFIMNIGNVTIQHGSFILSKNQMGGQVAHSIVNIGKQPRRVTKAAATKLISDLSNLPGEKVDVVSLMGDTESFELAAILEDILKQAGWQSSGVSQALFTGVPKGVIIETPIDKPSVQILGNWLMKVGLKPEGFLKPGTPMVKIIVGTAT